MGLVSDEKWAKTKALILELHGLVKDALVTSMEWMRPHLIVITRDAYGSASYGWSSSRKEDYQAWHTDPERKVPRQRLLEIKGFLNYVVQTYLWMNPYLKGLHLIIDGWREWRIASGWRAKGP